MLTIGETLIRLVLAVFLGGVVGWERERHDKAAGLRTHILVSVASALVMIVSTYGFNSVLSRESTVLDPSRVAAGVVTGIGFLGAGIIIFRRDVVVGLTTAAGIWAVSAIGLAVGGGLYWAAIATTAIALFVFTAVRPLEARIRNVHERVFLTVEADHNFSMKELEEAVASVSAVLKGLQIESCQDEGACKVKIIVERLPEKYEYTIVEALKKVSGAKKVALGK